MYHKIQHQIFQIPHHMHPHFSSNHPQHISKASSRPIQQTFKDKDDYNFIQKLFTLGLTAPEYPNKLITKNSLPWLPYCIRIHKRRLTNKTQPYNNNLQFTAAANTTNTLELTKMDTASFTNTITRIYVYPQTHQSLLQHCKTPHFDSYSL